MPLTPGSILENRYRVDRLLGQGGMGAVYRAWDARLEQWVALKENAFVTADARAQFEREAKILARLHHTNLPKVIDHFITAEDLQYLVMTYVDGVNLAELLATRGRQSPDSVMAWLGQVCDALTYLHNQNPPIIHRDVKPQNIKITPDDQVFLVDFGLSKVGVQQRTVTGALGVTPGFSPPEQYGDNAHTDQATDVYALTATLYAMLTGVVPPDSVQLAIGRALLPPPRQSNPAIPAALEQAILAGLETQPGRRTPTVAALRQQVSAALSPDIRGIAAAIPLPLTTRLPTAVSTQARIRSWMLLFVGAFATILLILALWLVRHSPEVTQSPATNADIFVAEVTASSHSMTPALASPNVQLTMPTRQPTIALSPRTRIPPTATMWPISTFPPTYAPTVFPTNSADQIVAVSSNRVVPMDPNQAVSSSFSQLTFCTRRDFDLQNQECMTSTTLFTGVIEIVYVSWKPPEAYRGTLFTRKWYIDGESFLERTTYKEYGYLETDQRPGLKPGRYRVELYVGDILVQEGGFIIQ